MLAEARATDAAELDQQALFGLDRLPVELSTRGGRLALLEVALATIEAGDAAEAEGGRCPGGQGTGGAMTSWNTHRASTER